MAEDDLKPIAKEVVNILTTRYDYIGKITMMASTPKYIMCRRPHCFPFVLHIDDWMDLSEKPLK